MLRFLCVCVVFALCVLNGANSAGEYHGKFIGALKSYHHGLGGEVYVVDSRTLHIRNFAYDGEGPAGYFYVSNTKTPNENGLKIRDEKGSFAPLKRYRKKHITLTLPEGKNINQFKWFYVWCDDFAVNFGDVKIPKNLDFPKPQKLGKLSGVHHVSSDNIVVVDAQTLLVPSFSYDGEAPDAKFWVGTGSKPSPQGYRVPDENGKEEPLRRYDRKTIVLTLPGDLTIFDIGYFGVWCEAFTVDFGHVEIPQDINVPPSLKMLGVSPQSKLNCEILHDDLNFEVRWAVAGDSIVIQLVAKLEKGEYMSFGVSGQIDKNVMLGGDVVTAWIDQDTMNGYAYDYYLDSKSQCAGASGSCPDVKLQPNTENIRLLNAALVNGYSIVTYQRPLRAHDELDLPIYTNGSQAVIWAIGPLNSLKEVSYHSITSKSTILMDFGRPPQWNCPIPESDAHPGSQEGEQETEVQQPSPPPAQSSRRKEPQRKEGEITKRVEATPAPAKREGAWEIPPIQCNEPEDGVFYAQMGPTGGKRGYPAITGHVGWGISWYINGLLIPEVNVVRNKTYTFVVEGGFDPNIPAKYHPFYITDDSVGGFAHKTAEEKANIQLFAGVTQNKAGDIVPTGVGRLCNWTPDPDQPLADEFASFGAYQRTLSLVCDQGEPGVIQWTPDENTPDTVYYQCFTHRYLGWKINVLDSCDKEPPRVNSPVTARIKKEDVDAYEEPEAEQSIAVVTRIRPDAAPNAIPYPDNRPFTDPYMPPPPFQRFPYETIKDKTLHVKPVVEDPYRVDTVYPRPPKFNLKVKPVIPSHGHRHPMPKYPPMMKHPMMKHPTRIKHVPYVFTKPEKFRRPQRPIPVPVPAKKYVKEEKRPSPIPVPLASLPPDSSYGFNPGSIVIEGGFKPIIPRAAAAEAEERMSEDEIDDESELQIGVLDNSTTLSDETEGPTDVQKNPFEGKEPELFEPMFIPSPPIRVHGKKTPEYKESRKKPGKNGVKNINNIKNSAFFPRKTKPTLEYFDAIPVTEGEKFRLGNNDSTKYIPLDYDKSDEADKFLILVPSENSTLV